MRLRSLRLIITLDSIAVIRVRSTGHSGPVGPNPEWSLPAIASLTGSSAPGAGRSGRRPAAFVNAGLGRSNDKVGLDSTNAESSPRLPSDEGAPSRGPLLLEVFRAWQ